MPTFHSLQDIRLHPFFTALVSAALAGALWTSPAMGKEQTHAMPGGVAKPRLVLLLMVDGLPNEQLMKNHDLFVANGFRRLMDQGAWYSDAHQAHAFTVTCIGHTAVLTGAYPYQHGIIGNEWRTRDGKHVYCMSDDAHTFLDGTPVTADDGTSPKNMRVSTVGDELRYSNNNASRVFGVSGKDRGAMTLAGKTGTAYMFSSKTGRFTSTTYYMKSHPEWWEKYYAGNPQDAWFHKTWTPLLPAEAYARSIPDGQTWSTSYKKMPTRLDMTFGASEEKPGPQYYGTLRLGPFGDEAAALFTAELAKAENLGRNTTGAPDILAVSFSGHDVVNHNFGPESIESQDHLIRLDRIIAGLIGTLDKQVGRDNILIVLTADHGFMNVPEYSASRGFEAGHIDSAELRATVNKAAEQKYGLTKVITQSMTGGVTLDYAAIDAKNLNREEVETFVARAITDFPGMAFAFTRTQLERGTMPPTRVGLLVTRAWNRQMAIDIAYVQKPFYFFRSKTTTTPNAASHGTPYAYDTNVPLMFQGARWIKPGHYTQGAEVVDIASTLSTILSIRPPSGAEGRALSEILRTPQTGVAARP
ncbi:MAG: alkaline phosphatase family protein [Betaproteobacteria bacterium]